MVFRSVYSSLLPAASSRQASAITAFDTVSGLLDLTKTPRPVSGALTGANSEETQASLTMLARLLQQGVVGTETYDVNGRPYTRFIETTIGDRRLNGLKPYRDRSVTSSRLDQRA
ncbi:MAG: hypothetical protein HZB26_18090 [Candidatus Hydrogenedentes bacterium]|nr:hypothetical protein [Candidatus Hydrogenedentota bacterium]